MEIFSVALSEMNRFLADESLAAQKGHMTFAESRVTAHEEHRRVRLCGGRRVGGRGRSGERAPGNRLTHLRSLRNHPETYKSGTKVRWGLRHFQLHVTDVKRPLQCLSLDGRKGRWPPGARWMPCSPGGLRAALSRTGCRNEGDGNFWRLGPSSREKGTFLGHSDAVLARGLDLEPSNVRPYDSDTR